MAAPCGKQATSVKASRCKSSAIMPTSTEFFKLCQSQVALLTQGMGAALSIVYLTEELTTSPDTQLIPFVAHPEVALNWGEEQILSFLAQVGANLYPRRLLTADSGIDPQTDANQTQALLAQVSPASPYRISDGLLPKQQMVLPLIYQERVMGLLVTARADRAWNEVEQAQIEHVAQTLTAACILEWRSRWLAQDLQQQQLLEEQKTDLFDDLLHQFRNPLTAVRTFGKLLLKRLRPGDTNRSVAESIVRESDRLQELLQQLDTAIDLDVTDLLPLLHSDQEPQSPFQPPLPSETATRLPDPRTETRMLLGSAIDLRPQAITTVLQPLLETAAAIAQDRQLTLQSEIPANLPPLLIDGRALREVLNNLLDNALKYTPAGGQIYIGVQRQPVSESPITGLPQSGFQPLYYQVIVIADTGPGIPPEDLQHLFERHYRGIQATTDIPGTGLGLTIARELVSQMGGHIQIFSPAVASGLIPANLSQLAQPEPAQKSIGTAAAVWLCEVSDVEASDKADVLVTPTEII
ncbi:MAG: HAMP domain-containing histidine kinase [Elainella sp. C42_A2020_010]|nr:HAMP domain-containing histidine kinase [Elainella sp. C42_A2020_010]RNJ70145.1 MAG: sensor histidine kinase [Leptolyngbya sp. IPPAS B-1204]